MRHVLQRILWLSITFCFLQAVSFADLSLVSSSVQKTVVPVQQDVVAFYMKVNSTSSETLSLTEIQLSASGQFDFNNEAYSAIKIYEDGPITTAGGDGEFDSTQDTLLNSTSSIDTGVPIVLSISGQSISSDNVTLGYGYWVVIELDEDNLSLGQTSTLRVDSLTATNSDSDLFTINDVISSTITATGLTVDYVTTIVPDFVFPGQDDVALLYWTAEPKGEGVTDLEITIENSFSNFVDSSNSLSGVDQVELFQSAYTGGDLDTKVTFNRDVNTVVGGDALETIEFGDLDWSPTMVVLNNAFPELVEDEKAGFWITYDVGEEISVTQSTQLNLTVTHFLGEGSNSSLPLLGTTTNVSVSVDVAGITIEDLVDQTTNDSYGPYTFSTMLGFKLRSHQAATTVNQINIINDGSVPFYTNAKTSKGGTDVITVEIYQDGGNESFSKDHDTLVGRLECHQDSNNSSTVARVTMNVGISVYNSSLDFPANNEEMFFVVYYFGSTITDSSDVSGNFTTASVGSISASGNYTINSVERTIDFFASDVRDDVPVSSSPTSNITFSDTNVAISEVLSIVPNAAYEGEEDVPMVYVELESDNEINAGTMKIRNSITNFYGNSDGVTKVSIYRDVDSSQTLTDSDTFVASSIDFTQESSNSNEFITIENVKFNQGTNKFIVAYSIGFTSVSNSPDVEAQISDVSADGESVVIGGTLPAPDTPVLATIQENLLSSVGVSDTTITDATTTFNVTMSLTNKSGSAIDVADFKPKFYLSDIGGLDISYEFDVITLAGNTAFDLANNATAEVTFAISHASPYSEGTVKMDAFVQYAPDGEANKIFLQRYKNGSGTWTAIGSRTLEFSVLNDMPSSDIFPAYVDTVKLNRGGSVFGFLNGSSVKEDDIMEINFVDASTIDQGSIRLVRGTDILFQQAALDIDQKYYVFDRDENVLSFYVGKMPADVTITMSDYAGGALNLLLINYSMSSTVELTFPLFYPSPYPIGSDNLKLGFSISQPSTVSLYIYNFAGIKVYETSAYFSDIGFNSFSFLDSDDFVVPGMYICRVVAKDSNGNSSVKTTKLAVY